MRHQPAAGEARGLAVARGFREMDLALADAVIGELRARLLALRVSLPGLGQQELAAVDEHAVRLAEHGRHVGHVMQRVDDGDRVEGRVRERQGRHVRGGEARGQVLAREAVAAHAEQRNREIESERPVAQLRQELADPAGTASQVQHPAAARDPEVLGDHQERVEEPDVLVAVARRERLGDVVVVLLFLRVAELLGLAAVAHRHPRLSRQVARPRGGVVALGERLHPQTAQRTDHDRVRRAEALQPDLARFGVADVLGGGIGAVEGGSGALGPSARGERGRGREAHRPTGIVEPRPEHGPQLRIAALAERQGGGGAHDPGAIGQEVHDDAPHEGTLRTGAGVRRVEERQVSRDAVAEGRRPVRVRIVADELAQGRGRAGPRTPIAASRQSRELGHASEPPVLEAQQRLDREGHFEAGGNRLRHRCVRGQARGWRATASRVTART